MKNFHLLVIITTFFYNNLIGQTNCADANSYLVSAYSHIKTSYDSYNISDLQYYANRSLEALKLSKNSLTDCDCETSLVLIEKSLEILEKVDHVKTYEDGRFYVKRAREACKESVIEIDKCSVSTISDNGNNDLENLKNEQLKLQQQQEALKLKAEEIKLKLAKQKEKEVQLQRATLINSFKTNITSIIKVYNETLNTCGCANPSVSPIVSYEKIELNSIDEINEHYMNYLKALAGNYYDNLNDCNSK